MNVSVVIPSRHRVERLKKAIASVFSTCHNKANVEVIVRFGDDDTESLSQIPKLIEMGNVRVIVGKNAGYKLEHVYLWDLCQEAKGIWIWGLNDDTVVLKDSRNWDARLMDRPRTGEIVMPFHHCLGASVYRKDPNCPFAILPNKWWEPFGIKAFVHPTDRFAFDTLLKAGWRKYYMRPLIVHHDRRPDALMKEENRL